MEADDVATPLTAVASLTERLRLLSSLAGAVSAAAGNYQELLDVIVRRIGEATSDSCVLRMAREAGAGLEPGGAVYNRDPELEALHRAILWDQGARTRTSIAERVLATGAPVLMPEVDLMALQAAATPTLAGLFARLATRSLIAVPLRAGTTIAAVLILGRCAGRPPFDDSDRALVEELAMHAGVAITNAKLIATTARTAERLRVLAEASATFAASEHDLGQVQDRLARELRALLGGLAMVNLIDEHGAATARAFMAHDEPALADRIEHLQRQPPDGSVGVRGRVLAGETVSITGAPEDIAAQVTASARATVIELGVRSILGLPLRAGAEVLGSVVVLRTSSAAFTREEQTFAEELVRHAALAIRNGTLLAAARHELAERERTEQALRKSEEQLRHAQKMEAIGRLAGGVAHDFNNLLSVVLSSCEFMEGDLPPDHASRDDVAAIRQAGERAAKMTKQLLAFSRQQALELELLDLSEQLVAMQPWLQRLVGESYAVVTRLAPSLGRVRADATHVQQVVMNLAINARDAMPDGGTLTLETANVELDAAFTALHPGVRPGRHVMLAVTDTGEGMSPDVRERIFEPFFTTKPAGKGTGLGLSTVFGIVQQNNGAIDVDSAPGRGATFRVYLPVTDGKEVRRKTVPLPATLRGSERVLVVEDEDDVRRVLVEILVRNGYRVIEASNGAEALAACDRWGDDIDLVLTDVVMPGMTGRQLADELRARCPHRRIVYMSGYAGDAILEHHRIDLDAPLLVKPLVADAVLRKLREALGAEPAPAPAP